MILFDETLGVFENGVSVSTTESAESAFGFAETIEPRELAGGVRSRGRGNLIVQFGAVRKEVEWSDAVVHPERASSLKAVWVEMKMSSGVRHAQMG